MVFSEFLYRIPYSLVWQMRKLFNRLEPVVFYCGDPLDHFVFEPVGKHLGEILYVTDKKAVKEFLKTKGIQFKSLPVFPKAVIMARHATHKFPCMSIIKIGMRHGAYHFKKMTSAASYNRFNLYLMTSQSDVEAGIKLGIKSAKAVGYPKLDPAFDGTLDEQTLEQMRRHNKPTVLFTATYDASGMSAVNLWYDKLHNLTDKYNILVTTHPWVDRKFAAVIKNTTDVHYIDDFDILPWLKLADVMVGDTSSILAECCALDKPIITFRIEKAKRSLDEIERIIDSISYRITDFNELTEKLDYAVLHKDDLKEARAQANALFFDILDGKAAERAADEIKRLLNIGD